ncbi:hypothetical protein ACU686_03175 [Yinghuangia aomiensis]
MSTTTPRTRRCGRRSGRPRPGSAADLCGAGRDGRAARGGPGRGCGFLDAALDDGEAGAARLPVIVERLVAGLGGHLTDEEEQALAVLDKYATPGTPRPVRRRAQFLDGRRRAAVRAVDASTAPSRISTPRGLCSARAPRAGPAGVRVQHWAPAYAETELWIRG